MFAIFAAPTIIALASSQLQWNMATGLRATPSCMSANIVTPEGTNTPARRYGTSGCVVVYVDGNNLMMQRKVTKGREQLAGRLTGILNREVVLVFDGKPGEQFQESGQNPRVVITDGGPEDGSGRQSADDWIASQLVGMPKGEVVEVVTADRYLRKAMQRSSVKTINPVKWWRRYLPRLKGLKTDYSNAPLKEE